LLENTEEPKNILSMNNPGLLAVSILNPKAASWVIPGDRSVYTGNHARAAFEASGELHLHLASLFIEGIEVGRAGIDTEALPAVLTGGLIEGDMAGFVVLEGVLG